MPLRLPAANWKTTAPKRLLKLLAPGIVRRGWRCLRTRCEFILQQRIEPWVLGLRVEHVAGPERVPYGPDEVLAICVVRNGAAYLRSFVAHHLRMGVCHVVLLDNGSTDETVAIARKLERVTVLRTDAPYQRYENVMKRYLARRFSRGRWNLCVDIDERFDYPFSDCVDLKAFIAYLRSHGYTAVVAQMLDLFPDCSLAELASYAEQPVEAVHTYYDLANIRRTNYRYGVASNPEIRMHWDGIRHALFGSSNGLTKAPLVHVGPSTDLFTGWHHVNNARIADLSALLLHYPFGGAFHTKVRDAVETGRYGEVTTDEYEKYWSGLSGRPDLRFRQPTSRRWKGMEGLLAEGFLVASPQYRQWATARSSEALQPESASAGAGHE